MVFGVMVGVILRIERGDVCTHLGAAIVPYEP